MRVDLSAVPMPIRLASEKTWSDDQLFAFCESNRMMQVEREPNGEISIMTPAGFLTWTMNERIARALGNWAEADGRGVSGGPDGGFLLRDGSMRSPDAAWVSLEQVNCLSDAEKRRFVPLCPEFVVELRSPSDSLPAIHRKMQDWIDNGAVLGWLIDPESRQVWVYHALDEREELVDPSSVQGSGPVAGFELVLARVWG